MKNLSKKGGISLVALVITIIVLIILTGAVIATFMEGGIVDRAKESVFKNDIRTYQEILAVKKAEEDIKVAVEKGHVSKFANPITDIQTVIPEYKEEYEGLLQIVDGVLVLGETEKDPYSDWLDELGIGTGEVTVEALFTDTNGGEIDVGDEIVHENGEVFYVIGLSGDNVNMLAKYNLDSNGKQSTTGETIVFCTSDTWIGASVADGDNLNEKTTIQADSTSAVYKAKEYGESLGVTGRLMLYDEAEALKTSQSTILYGQYETGSYLNYWLGSADDTNRVWCVYGESGNLNGYRYVFTFGVRPVITISESAINKATEGA